MPRNLFWLTDEQWKRIEPQLPTDDLKTAKALGLTVPLPLLARADEVIE